uniref:Uncharacterized protein n=1 Tax=Ciona savignyi TaxID=51511 RepID=H2YF50_CIOSA
MFCSFQYSNHLVPNRDENSKYFVSREVYPDAQFPHFCHGGLTVLSFPILSEIYRLAEITNRTGMVLEDVLINGILRYKLGKKNSNIKRVIQPRLGPMLWHLSNADELHFKLAWSAVTTLLTIRVHNRTRYVGLFPSARMFLADMNDAVLPMLH